MPRQEFVDAIDRMVGDAGDDVGEIGLDIKAAHLRRLDDGVEGGGAPAAGVAAGEGPVAAPEGQGPDGPLGVCVS